MNREHYNNIINWTLKKYKKDIDTNSLDILREILNNMGIPLPHGDMESVLKRLNLGDYMNWSKCSLKEAQNNANRGIATIGFDNDHAVILAAETYESSDEEKEKSEAVISITETTSIYDVMNLEYYSYSNTRKSGSTISGWLDLYTYPSITGRKVNIPSDVDPYKWYAFEGNTNINYYARLAIENTNAVYIGKYGELVDNDMRYWVAVGPKVMNPNHSNSVAVTPEEMKYGTRIDVKLQHTDGNYYYLRGVVGDCKNHTYSNGIYQTGYAFPNGCDPYPENADGSVIEFCGALLPSKLSQYKIISITVEE